MISVASLLLAVGCSSGTDNAAARKASAVASQAALDRAAAEAAAAQAATDRASAEALAAATAAQAAAASKAAAAQAAAAARAAKAAAARAAAVPTPAPAHVVPTTAAPKGTVQISSYQRLPDSQQDAYGCDKQIVTIVNRSNAAVDKVSVSFQTSYMAESADGMTSTGPLKTGPTVVKTATAGIGPYAQTDLTFSPCVPSANSRYVFASPVKVTWTWA